MAAAGANGAPPPIPPALLAHFDVLRRRRAECLAEIDMCEKAVESAEREFKNTAKETPGVESFFAPGARTFANATEKALSPNPAVPAAKTAAPTPGEAVPNAGPPTPGVALGVASTQLAPVPTLYS